MNRGKYIKGIPKRVKPSSAAARTGKLSRSVTGESLGEAADCMEQSTTMEKTNTTTRHYGLDILRLLATLMVVVIHVQAYGGRLEGTHFSAAFATAVLLESLCIVALNCFVLITGFFMIHQKSTWQKVAYLLGDVFLVSWIVFIVGSFCGLRTSASGQLNHLFPIFAMNWFVPSYLLIYIFSPWTNKFILSLRKNECLFFYMFLGIILSLGPLLPGINEITARRGYSALWLWYVYCVGAVMKLYVKPISHPAAIYWGTCLLTAVITFGLACSKKLFWPGFNFNSPLVFLGSIGLFYYFYQKTVHSARLIRWITLLVPGCFGVFLIHVDVFLRPVYKKIFTYFQVFPIELATCLVAAVVYGICLISAVLIHRLAHRLVKTHVIPFVERKVLATSWWQALCRKYEN